MSKRILTIIGARPQFVKAGQVSIALKSAGLQEKIVHTGQHFDSNMSEVFFQELGLPEPDWNLGIGGGSHGKMTGRQLEAIETILIQEDPDRVLVYGDTNSTLAGSLAAAKLHIPVAHVEAGLRSFNKKMPEEINRILTDNVADLLFTPTTTATNNLISEGFSADSIFQVGDVMLDASRRYKSESSRPAELPKDLNAGFVLATVHRAENTDDKQRLSSIFDGLSRARRSVVLPVHPRTKKQVDAFGIKFPNNFVLLPPIGFLEMNWLEGHCDLVATDSGGVQKEAYFHDKCCLTLRDETEWVELIEHGSNVLVGADSSKIEAGLLSPPNFVQDSELYGDGNASAKIAAAL